MKILAIGPLPSPITGQALAFEAFVDELKTKHEVDVINLSKIASDSFPGRLVRVWQTLCYVWQAWWLSRRADTVYFTISESVLGNLKDLGIYLACFSKLGRMTVHLNGGAGMRELLAPSRTIFRSMNRFFLRRVHRVIVLGPSLVDIFDGMLSPDRIVSVPNFAADELFVPGSAISEKFSKVAPLRLLFLSNLLWGKGYVELLAAYATLSAEVGAAIQLDIAGAFESDGQGQTFLATIARLPGVRYHGIVTGSERQALFRDAHIFCLPTYYPTEGQPLSILEAYASGCVVLTTRHSGIVDVFSAERNGYEVEKKSDTSILQALKRALGEPSSLHRMAQANRQAAEAYRVDVFNRRMTDIVIPAGLPGR